MDKQYYKPTEKEIQEIAKKFNKVRTKILRELAKSDMIKRKRVVKDYEVLLEAAFRMVQKSLSYRRLSLEMSASFHVSMSAMAWKKRLEKFVPLLLKTASAFLDQGTGSDATYLIDATEIPVEGGKGYSARIHTCYELNSKTIDQYMISDWHTAETVRNFSKIHANATYIADRAYGKAGEIAYLLEKQANYLFRITPHNLALYKDGSCRNKLDLKTLLIGDTLDIHCYISYRNSVYRVRIVATQIPDEKCEVVKKRLRRQASRRQHNVSANTILLSQWLILATSLTLPIEEVTTLYRKRWQIEILFKRAKTLFHFHRLHHCKSGYMFHHSAIWFTLVILASFLLDACSWHSSPFDFFSLFCLFFS